MRIVKFTINMTPLQDLILPAPSSRILKTLILQGYIFPSLKDLVKSKDKNKPLFISMVGTQGKRLFSKGEILKISKGQMASSSISFPFYEKSIDEIKEDTYDTPFGKIVITVDRIDLLDLSSIKTEKYLEKNIKIKFLTPPLLTSKVLLPPSLKEKYKSVRSGYSILPSIGLISSYAYKTYLSALGKNENPELDTRQFKIGVLTNALSEVFGFSLEPITIIIGRDDKGNLRKTRGPMGWIEFDIKSKKLKKRIIKYLLVSSFLGLGKSRGIGLGEIEIS
ncbi:CRISPR system precrRNA processing endoribonuclease RAMP protein Cas6 [Acidianus manzaensis]|nr:CRISPR system precrRNA processing endoribonuclease RAMP protein Cas6 [Acidianus manzaensis]